MPNCRQIKGYTHSLTQKKVGKKCDRVLQNVHLACFAGECTRESERKVRVIVQLTVEAKWELISKPEFDK